MGSFTTPRAMYARSVRISGTNILDRTIYNGKMSHWVFFFYDIFANQRRHVRLHHKDKSRDDPELRAVLARRPKGSRRGRRRRSTP